MEQPAITWFDWLMLAAAVVPVALTIIIWRLDRRALLRESGRSRRAAIVQSFDESSAQLIQVARGHEEQPDWHFFQITSRVSQSLGIATPSEQPDVVRMSLWQDRVVELLLRDENEQGAYDLIGWMSARGRSWVQDPKHLQTLDAEMLDRFGIE